MGTKIQRKPLLTRWVFVIVIAVLIVLAIGQFIPTAARVLAGLVLAMIFLLIFLLDRQTRKDVLREMEDEIGWVNFHLANEYLRYLTSFNISLDNRCPESIKKKVLQFFDDKGFICRVVDRRKGG